MTRQLIVAAAIAMASFIATSNVHADCGSHACPTHYGRYTAREAFVLFQKHPELIQRFPQIAQQLQTQFGPIQAAEATPAVPVNPAPTTPAQPPAVATPPAATPPAAVEENPVPAEAPAVVTPPATEDVPPAAPPTEAPVEESVSAETEIDPSAPPADLPLDEPPAEA